MKELVRIVLEGENNREKIGFFSLVSKKLSWVSTWCRSGYNLGISRESGSKTQNNYCNSFQRSIVILKSIFHMCEN